MPDMSYTPKSINDKSMLSPGWHPAYLVQIADEETPPDWQMAHASPRMWRWVFAVWETPAHVAQSIPEMQSTPSSQKFSPGGKFQASKAYVFTRKLLNRAIEPGEHINLDALMPLPCQVLVSRTNKNGEPIEYANLSDLQSWPDGTALLTPDVKANLATWLQSKTEAPSTEPHPAPVRQPTTPAPALAQPGMQSWAGAPAPTQPVMPAKAGW